MKPVENSRRAAAVAVVAAICACGGSQRPRLDDKEIEDPDLLVAAADISADFTAQQRVHVKFRDKEAVFQAIVKKAGDKLIVVALTPQGQRAFVLEQSGKVVSFEQYAGPEMPFSPWHILVDIHRTYFRGGSDARADGEHDVGHVKEAMRERWSGGRLRERRITRAGKSGGPIIVTYRGDAATLLERPLLFDNRYVGYTLDITPITVKYK